MKRRATARFAMAAATVALLSATPAAAKPLRLIMFGDSLTQGYGLRQGAGLVPRLQAWLRARGWNVELINAGVSGDTTAGGRSRIAWTLAGGGDAIVVALGGNDVLRGIPPADSRDNLDTILKAVRAKNLPCLLIGVPAPANYGAKYRSAFDAIYPDLAAKYHCLLIRDYFAPLHAGTTLADAMQRYMQPDGIHPSAAGVERIVAAYGPEVETLLKQVNTAAPRPATQDAKSP